ncbi:MAG: sterol desaturase family protein [Fimbriimonadaceae bacterium]|nr:sterol desaturase family protein [Alphaproteobacteria bacterium]
MFNLEDPSESGYLRLGIFILVLAIMGGLEAAFPRRWRRAPQGRRWGTNLAIVLLNSFALRLLFPVAAMGTAIWARQNGYGLFNILAWPQWIEDVCVFLLLDFAIYFQHVISHKIPVLWRLHQVHHADPDIDVTTGIRFHPIEILLSMAYKMGLVLAIGPSLLAVFIFEVVLNGGALFNHANLKLPLALDRVIRRLIVTPDMHRVHHSVIHRETDSNYGFNLSIWDRLCGTYIDQPEKGHDDMMIGLAQYRSDGPTRLAWSLLLPFRSSGAQTRGETLPVDQ